MSISTASRVGIADGARADAPTRLLRLEGAALLAGNGLGARVYNLFHITPLPGLLIAVGWWQNASLASALGLIWLAHIGMDRMLGYGLKYDDDFQHTHLSSPQQTTSR